MSMHTQFKQQVYYQSYGKNVPKPKELQKWHFSDLIYTLEHVKKRVQKFSLKVRTSFRPVCTYIILDMQKKEAFLRFGPKSLPSQTTNFACIRIYISAYFLRKSRPHKSKFRSCVNNIKMPQNYDSIPHLIVIFQEE